MFRSPAIFQGKCKLKLILNKNHFFNWILLSVLDFGKIWQRLFNKKKTNNEHWNISKKGKWSEPKMTYTCWLSSCLYEENHPNQVRRLTWLRYRQNGVFHFVKTNRLYENGFIPPRWDFTPRQVRFHLGGMVFLHVNSFCWAVPLRQHCLFS